MAQSLLQILPEPTLVERIAAQCLAHGLRVGVAESCTGGLVAAVLTEAPGSSAWFAGGVVSYAEAVKHAILGVSEATLARHGAVSAGTARAMAEGARRLLDVDVAVSVTGLAGPDGDGIHPVGTVFVGVTGPNGTTVSERHFSGDRTDVRAQACGAALAALVTGVEG